MGPSAARPSVWPLIWQDLFDKYSIPYTLGPDHASGEWILSLPELDTAWNMYVKWTSKGTWDGKFTEFFFESYLGGHRWQEKINFLRLA